MKIIKTKRFAKRVKKLPTKLQEALFNRIRLFVIDPQNATLNNRPLKGALRNYRSINITGDYRLIFEPLGVNTVRFVSVDTHHNLYGG